MAARGSINGMLYVRGQAFDYDLWARLGNRGWSYDEILPYFKKSETFERGGDEYRGGSGELNVADMVENHPIFLDAYQQAGAELGYPVNPDSNDNRKKDLASTKSLKEMVHDLVQPRLFLDPARKRRNLKIMTNALVHQVLLDGRKAVGVRYRIGGNVV